MQEAQLPLGEQGVSCMHFVSSQLYSKKFLLYLLEILYVTFGIFSKTT